MKTTLKKTLSIFLAILMIVTTVPMAFAADIVASGTCGENVSWTLDSDGLVTISGEGEMTESPFWYNDKDKVRAVVIEDGVTNIVRHGFEECSNLTSLTISGSVKKIGEFAFAFCSQLTEIYMPDGVTVIDAYAFENCSRLVEVTIPESVTKIGESAFVYCWSLKKVNVPDTWETPLYDFGDTVTLNATHNNIVLVEAKAPTCSAVGWEAYEYCADCTYTTYEEIPTTGIHADGDGDSMCDGCGEQLTCEDCLRPVHGDNLAESLICLIVMLLNLIKTAF